MAMPDPSKKSMTLAEALAVDGTIPEPIQATEETGAVEDVIEMGGQQEDVSSNWEAEELPVVRTRTGREQNARITGLEEQMAQLRRGKKRTAVPNPNRRFMALAEALAAGEALPDSKEAEIEMVVDEEVESVIEFMGCHGRLWQIADPQAAYLEMLQQDLAETITKYDSAKQSLDQISTRLHDARAVCYLIDLDDAIRQKASAQRRVQTLVEQAEVHHHHHHLRIQEDISRCSDRTARYMRDSFAHCLTAIEALKHDQREAQREFTACDASEREAQESVVNFEAHMKSLLDQEMGQRMDREQAELEINAYPAAIVSADAGPVNGSGL
ncbi:hypothetical protein BFJ69_g16523 [Fusarium oxysporum]|uniref:Uncharacterized protein n=1 Tax=Fusarium oxysporum TaxID=5507 RepID=A0A420MAZ1_FUSOX|nr:hypothetical protein BFJ69_g16523 [Fusarium oxysporum]